MDGDLILVLLFYFVVVLVIYANREKFQIYAKIIAMYRTHVGLKSMDWIAVKFPRLVKFLGYIGIGFAFLGMFYIGYILIEGAILLLTDKLAVPVITPVIPGVKIPGSPLFVPFWYGIISIFVVAAIHEFSHGVVARVHGVKVKNTGVVFFGPIIGAFVEPDEKALRKLPVRKQLSVFSAGPFSNLVTGVLILLLMLSVLGPFLGNIIEGDGVKLTDVESGLPAEAAGLEEGDVVRYVDGKAVGGILNFTEVVRKYSAGDALKLSDGEREFDVNLVENPKNSSLPYMGVILAPNYKLKDSVSEKYGKLPWGIFYFMDLLKWIFILSIGIGLANLMPLGPVDGGRMVYVGLGKFMDEQNVEKLWKMLSWLFVGLLLFNLLFPYVKHLF